MQLHPYEKVAGQKLGRLPQILGILPETCLTTLTNYGKNLLNHPTTSLPAWMTN